MRLRMADLCSRSEQCEYDIRQKVIKAGILNQDADEILNFLKREKFIDDARFATAYARDKVRFSGWGRHKIRLMLTAKRISADIISQALDSIDMKDYAASLKRVGIAKLKSLDLNKREDAAKLYKHLLSRGFESKYALKFLEAARKHLNQL